MTVFFCVLLFIVACYFIVKWLRKRTTRNNKDKTKRSTTDERIPMNPTKDNNNELTTA
jgi:amino acid permease